MQAGELRHRIWCKLNVGKTKDKHGQLIPDWQPQFGGQRWAKVQTLTGREFFMAKKVHAETTHLITLRADPQSQTITSAWRIEFEGRTFEILSTRRPEERRILIELFCKESV